MSTRSFGGFRLAGLFVLMASVAVASPVVVIVASVGPAFTSPNLDAYEVNAEYALEHGLSSYGSSGTPAYYSAPAGSPINPVDLINTTFNSWLGQAPPPGGYSGEFGNDLFFGLAVVSDIPFTMDQVTLTGDFPSDLTGVAFSDHTIGVSCSTVLVGGVCTGTTTRYDNTNSSGATIDGNTNINFLWTSGIFVNYNTSDPSDLDPNNPNSLVSQLSGNTFSAQYHVTDANSNTGDSASLTFDLQEAPEPGTLSLFGVSLAALLCFRKRAVRRS